MIPDKLEEFQFPPEISECQVPSDECSKNDSLDDGDEWCEEASASGAADGCHEVAGKALDLNREWQRRHDLYYTIGFREGLILAKEASSKVGFTSGFKETVPVGYQFGIVRGVTSSLACLPVNLKQRIVIKLETREKLGKLHALASSISSEAAFEMFRDGIVESESGHSDDQAGPRVEARSGGDHVFSKCCELVRFTNDLKLLLHEIPDVDVYGALDRKIMS